MPADHVCKCLGSPDSEHVCTTDQDMGPPNNLVQLTRLA
jgi:hypothetical protein